MTNGDWFSRVKSHDTSCGHVMSHDKFKTLELLFYKTRNHQPDFQRSRFGWGAPGYILPGDYKIMLQMKHSCSITKLGWEKTYSETWQDQIMLSTSQRFSALGFCSLLKWKSLWSKYFFMLSSAIVVRWQQYFHVV